MKKSKFLILSSFLSILLIACKNQETIKETYYATKDDYKIYEMGQDATIFVVDEDNNLYHNRTTKVEENETIDDGEEVIYSTDKSYIDKYNVDGTLVNSYEGRIPNHPVLYQQRFYGTRGYGDDPLELIETSLITSEVNGYAEEQGSMTMKYEEKVLTTMPWFDNSQSIHLAIADHKVFVIGSHRDYANQTFTSMKEDGYRYTGNKIAVYDLNTSQWEVLDIEYPISMNTTYDSRLLIYAYDKELGYYFTYYEPDTAVYSQAVYNDTRYLDYFIVYNDSNDFLYIENYKTIVSTNPSDSTIKKEMIPIDSTISKYHVKATKEFTYYVDGTRSNIIRLKNEAYLRNNKNIVTLQRKQISYMAPFGLGYSFKVLEKDKDEMALSILSKDDSFDLFQLHSNDDISYHIKEKAVFYPINDVPGVKEYLDACFPYIKVAATTTDGDIWMLPIFVDIPTYIYNNNLIKENNIDFNQNMDIDTFIKTVHQVSSSPKTKDLYFNLKDDVVRNIFLEYLKEQQDFDTDTFRQLAINMKQYLNYQLDSSHGKSMLNASYTLYKERDFLYLLQRGVESQLYFKWDEILHAMSIPSINNSQTRMASCYFIAVNPASENISESLNYISSLSKYLMQTTDYIMVQDRNHYTDTQIMDELYEIYSNGEIQFTLEYEIYQEDFDSYLRNEIDLDTFISEANRKLKIYLEE